jgi:hypothetical protein
MFQLYLGNAEAVQVFTHCQKMRIAAGLEMAAASAGSTAYRERRRDVIKAARLVMMAAQAPSVAGSTKGMGRLLATMFHSCSL